MSDGKFSPGTFISKKGKEPSSVVIGNVDGIENALVGNEGIFSILHAGKETAIIFINTKRMGGE